MQGKIGRAEFFSLALVSGLSGIILLGAAEKAAAQLAWLFMLAAVPIGLLVWLVFYFWLKLYAGQGFGVALGYAFGRAGGRIVLFAYAVFWLLLAELFGSLIAEFWASLGANNMPLWLYAALFWLVAACFAATGGTALARVALLVVVPSLILVLLNLWLTVWDADFGNLLPQTGMIGVIESSWLEQGLAYGLLLLGGLSALLPILQHTRAVKQQLNVLALGLAGIFVLWLAFALGNQVVLGASLPLYDFPVLQVFRLAEFGHWFSRFEVIGAVLLVMLALLRAAALFGAAVASLTELWAVPPQQRSCVWLVALGCWIALLVLFWLGQHWPLPAGQLLSVFICLAALFTILLPVLVIIFGALKFKKEHKNIVVSHKEY